MTPDRPDLDELEPVEIELTEDDEVEFDDGLVSHFRPGEDVAVLWTDKAMDRMAWLWSILDKSKVGVRVLVAGEEDWHVSKYSTVNGNRAVPRKLLSLSIDPESYYRKRDEPCLVTKAAPIRSSWRERLATLVVCLAVSLVLWVGVLPIVDKDLALVLGLEHGLLLGLWLCSFYGWRIRGPVSYAKFVLQMRAPWVLTPGQLYKAIERRNENMGW